MRKQIAFLITINSFYLFANPQLSCTLDMHQIDAKAPWGTVGDSNKRINLTLNPLQEPNENEFAAEQSVRFSYDQSEGEDRLSVHGLTLNASYSEGNGLTIIMKPLRYSSEETNAKVEILGGVQTSLDVETTEISKTTNISYTTPKIASLPKDSNLQDLIKENVLTSGDLLSLGISSCEFTK